MKMIVRGLIIVWIFSLGIVGYALGYQRLEPGLAGTYFEESDFTRPGDQIDILDGVDNDWGSYRGNDWAARWAGYIECPVSGEITFTARAVDGIRLLTDGKVVIDGLEDKNCLLYTSPSPRDATLSRMPSSA